MSYIQRIPRQQLADHRQHRPTSATAVKVPSRRAIAVLVMDILGTVMWATFKAIFADASTHASIQVGQIGRKPRGGLAGEQVGRRVVAGRRHDVPGVPAAAVHVVVGLYAA